MAIPNLPDQLKVIKPYITLATQLEQKNEKAIAYYLRVYSVQTGMGVNKTSPECKGFLIKMMDLIEQTKAGNKEDEAIQSETVGQSCVEGYALKIFEIADAEDRQSKFSKNLVKQFYTAGLLFDVLNYFGEINDDEILAKKQYAKRKAMYLNKCIQTGETPRPGPLVDDDFGEELNIPRGNFNQADNSSNVAGMTNMNLNDQSSAGASVASSKYVPTNEPINQNKTYYDTPAAPPAAYVEPFADNSSEPLSLSPKLMQKAQKNCKFAASALQYDDIPTAIKNLEECLRILKTGKE